MSKPNPNEAIVNLDGVRFKLIRMRINNLDFVEISKCDENGIRDLNAGDVIWHSDNLIQTYLWPLTLRNNAPKIN